MAGGSSESRDEEPTDDRAAEFARQRAELEMLVEGQRRLLEVGRSVLASLDTSEVLELLADSLQALIPHDGIAVYEADWAAHRYFPTLVRARFSDPEAEAVFMRTSESIDAGITGWVIRTGDSLNLVDAHLDPRGILIPGTEDVPEQLVTVPLMRDRVAMGTLKISRMAERDRAFTEAEFDLVQLFAGLASIALQNAPAHRAVVFAADNDALTGLFNHGAFQRDLRTLVERGPAEPFALLLLDLDRFKTFNDTHGHPAGDDLLRRVAEAIRASSRERDRACRYGDDELALLLRGAEADEARLVADRVAIAIAAITLGDAVAVTASVGVACWPAGGVSATTLVEVADRRVYEVKATRVGHGPR